MENALWNIATQLPIAIVLIIGTVVLAVTRSRLPGRSVLLGMLGIGVTALSLLLWVVWAFLAQNLADAILDSFLLVYNTVSTVINVVSAAGLLLLIFGICSAAAPATTPRAPQPGFPPPATGFPAQSPYGPAIQPQAGWTPPPAQQPSATAPQVPQPPQPF